MRAMAEAEALAFMETHLSPVHPHGEKPTTERDGMLDGSPLTSWPGM